MLAPVGDQSSGVEATSNPGSDMAPNDPTQRLLTALGRFHRQINLAKSGAPQDLWSDECMNQLISATEIALSQNWSDVVGALTDTARVLQTYESSDSAPLCVPFLADSYEILCLMVGDVIVGRVRPGVKQKWQERYRVALEDLAGAGLTLVRDDEEHGMGAEALPVVPESPEAAPGEEAVPEVAADWAPEEPFAIAPAAESAAHPHDDDLPTLDDLPPLRVAPEFETERPPIVSWEKAVAIGSECVPEPETQEISPSFPLPLEVVPQPPEPAEAAGAEIPIPAVSPADSETPEATEFAPVPSSESELGPALVRVLDVFCDSLSRLQEGAAPDSGAVVASLEPLVAELLREAENDARSVSAAACGTMTELLRRISLTETVPDDRFIELAYAFCGVYAEAGAEEDAGSSAWRAECRTYLESLPMERPAEPVMEAPMPTPRPAAPEEMLETARSAAATGRVSDAKLLALQAAAHFARIESEEAETRVREAEQRLHQGGTAIEQARAAVFDAEHAVGQAEAAMAEGVAELERRRTEVATVQRTLAEVEGRIGELDAQIRELTAKREAEQQVLAATGAELSGKTGAASQSEAGLEHLGETEKAARIHLEDARQEVKRLQYKRSEIEAALEKAREALTRRRISLADIEETIAQLDGDNEAAATEEHLLF
ncbi:MAG: hypothetical protein HY706_21400 [Candidatus Hydrogenedentes bacterium]|nr:hypothetical protein [Candidatus Hydrogenedentota bacterium]